MGKTSSNDFCIGINSYCLKALIDCDGISFGNQKWFHVVRGKGHFFQNMRTILIVVIIFFFFEK